MKNYYKYVIYIYIILKLIYNINYTTSVPLRLWFNHKFRSLSRGILSDILGHCLSSSSYILDLHLGVVLHDLDLLENHLDILLERIHLHVLHLILGYYNAVLKRLWKINSKPLHVIAYLYCIRTVWKCIVLITTIRTIIK